MISVEDAWRLIVARANPLGSVTVPLASALGRTLRTDVRADADSPSFDASAMDGYAWRRTDSRAPLRVVGTSQAGAAFQGIVGPGECVRIFTGAPVPDGADCVVKQEDVMREGDLVRLQKTDGPSFIRRQGENRRKGDVVVASRTLLGPPELAALAAAGMPQPEISRAPRCAHLVTGTELVAPHDTPVGAQIRDSNSTLIAALLAGQRLELAGQSRVGDDLNAARAVVGSLPAHDVLLISGGASVGDHDIARPLLEALGYELHFHQLNLRPGKPLVFASRGAQLAFALPGNPVSHWVVFHLFIAPVLRFLETGRPVAPTRLKGILLANSRPPPPDGRPTFWPSRVTIAAGVPQVSPLPIASSGDGSGLVGANALLPVPPETGNLVPDQEVEFIPCS